MTPKYYKVREGKPGSPKSKSPVFDFDDAAANSIFNFDPGFISGLQSVSAVELGQSVPYIRLVAVGLDGKDLFDANLSFFHKTVDLDKISQGGRFTTRPLMSLKELTVETDLAGGYLYWTKVQLRIRVHSPELLEENNGVLVHLMVPGSPLKLEYGWNSPNTFLGEKQLLLFQVKTYDLTINTTGQVDIRIEGVAFNETFNNVYIGDVGDEIVTDLVKGTQFDGIANTRNKLEILRENIDEASKGNSAIDPKLLKSLAESLPTIEEKVRDAISKRYAAAKENLEDSGEFTIRDEKKFKAVTLHDVIFTLCNETFEKMTSIFPSVSDKSSFRIIYGIFNENAGRLANQTIADFPINRERLENVLKEVVEQGQFVPTIGKLFNLLQSEFLENSQYYLPLLPKDKEDKKKVVKTPDIAINLTNDGTNYDLQIIDVNRDLPITTARIGDKKLSRVDRNKKILEGAKIPIIRVGHAGSFIKTMSMSQITDQHMKAVLIERMFRNRQSSVKSPNVQSSDLDSSALTPLTLPLRGTASVLGHVGWKPFKGFFFDVGIYTIDAVYKILKVSHKLSAEGFSTNIDFMYH
jgi:hypothetical protein